jgi:hypothetical protein
MGKRYGIDSASLFQLKRILDGARFIFRVCFNRKKGGSKFHVPSMHVNPKP